MKTLIIQHLKGYGEMMQIKIVFMTTIMSFNLSCACFACEPDRLPHMLDELEKGKNKKFETAYHHTLTILEKYPEMQQELLNKAIDILCFHPKNIIAPFPLMEERIISIDKAIIRFDTVPGFRFLLIKVIQECCKPLPSKIYWQELSAALLLQTQLASLVSQEKIVAFGLPYDYDATNSNARFYNIITNQRWIECKTIDWKQPAYNKTGRKRKKLQRQLLRQQHLIAAYNEQKQLQLSYEIFSKYPVNEPWQQWMAQHKIPYFVTN
jgi:hypothetical protein